MYFVIVGAGRIGISLAKWLVAADHEVAVIDREGVNCSAVDEELGSVSVVGDGTEAGVLMKAGVNRADVLIAVTGRDEDNLVACQMAKHRFNVERTIALANIPDHERLFDMLGIGVTINATELVLNKVQEELSGLLVEEIETR